MQQKHMLKYAFVQITLPHSKLLIYSSPYLISISYNMLFLRLKAHRIPL